MLTFKQFLSENKIPIQKGVNKHLKCFVCGKSNEHIPFTRQYSHESGMCENCEKDYTKWKRDNNINIDEGVSFRGRKNHPGPGYHGQVGPLNDKPELRYNDFPKPPANYHKILTKYGFEHHHTDDLTPGYDQQGFDATGTRYVYKHPEVGSKVHVDVVGHDMGVDKDWTHYFKNENYPKFDKNEYEKASGRGIQTKTLESHLKLHHAVYAQHLKESTEKKKYFVKVIKDIPSTYETDDIFKPGNTMLRSGEIHEIVNETDKGDAIIRHNKTGKEHLVNWYDANRGLKPLKESIKKIGHTKDSDCNVDSKTGLCRECGVDHSGGSCPYCGGKGFHKSENCPGMK